MQVSVFGANGKTGQKVVDCLVKQGFVVVAYVYRNPPNRYFPSTVRVAVGDVLDYDNVLQAVKGSDAVISVLGHIKNSDPLMQTKGISNIVRAMGESGIKRLLSLTGTGARETNDRPSIIDSILNYFIKLVDPQRINDGVEHIKILKKSNLEWTVVRVLKLSNSNQEINNYKLTESGPAELITSRKKVAKILVDLLTNDQYIKKLPVISG